MTAAGAAMASPVAVPTEAAAPVVDTLLTAVDPATFPLKHRPYREGAILDFGAFEHEGQRIFWKIDYYAPDMEHGSENPADPKQTVRVLTIMLPSEY